VQQPNFFVPKEVRGAVCAMKSEFLQKLLAFDPHSISSDDVDFYLIGELSEIVGLEPKTIRFYEKAGLLCPARHGRIRIFKRADIERLLLIKTLRKYDVSLANIRAVIAETDEGGKEIDAHCAIETLLAEQLKKMQLRKDELSDNISSVSYLLNAR
jgi:DNA-binding transcriptional MerR regulator